MGKTENELKYSLSAARDLEKTATFLGEPDRVEMQHNCYLDTESLALHRMGVLIRLRFIEGGREVLFTVKKAEKRTKGFISAREDERLFSYKEAEKILNSPGRELPGIQLELLQEVLKGVDPSRLEKVAELHNERRIYDVSAGELALDRVEIPGGGEFEVELETGNTREGAFFLDHLFSELNIPFRLQSEPKTTRLFRALYGNGGRTTGS